MSTRARTIAPPQTAEPAPVRSGLLQRCACGGEKGPSGECAACRRKKRLGLQPKLIVNAPGDRYEREADRIAEQVMQAREAGQAAPAPFQIQRVERAGRADAEAPPLVHDVLRSPGQPLGGQTQRFMETRFGHDFSSVRVHTDAQAAASARAVEARAYTVGRHVVFGAEAYRPEATDGKRLLAHELVHVVQQRGGATGEAANALGLQRASEEEEVLAPDPDEELVVGNTMDHVRGEAPAAQEAALTEGAPRSEAAALSEELTKSPKKKMGGPLGPVKEGAGGAAGKLSAECKEWVRLKRTTYGYDTAATDPVEKDFLDMYKDFKEGVPIAKPGDFNAKLKDATKSPCSCIGGLQVDGHGGSWSGGAQEFAPRKFKNLGERSFGVKKTADGKTVPYNFEVFDGLKFCKPCTITLGGCYVGMNKPKAEAGAGGFEGAGDALGKALAQKTGCSVTAYTGLTTTPKAGEFKGSGKGEWRTTPPPTK